MTSHGTIRWGRAWCAACNRWVPPIELAALHGHGVRIAARAAERLQALQRLAGDERTVASVLAARASLRRPS